MSADTFSKAMSATASTKKLNQGFNESKIAGCFQISAGTLSSAIELPRRLKITCAFELDIETS
jgi:hypothetical protein